MYRSIEVYQKIRDEITWGELNPGERLVENDLSKKYGLSRGPIRVAFHYLEKDGYINILHNKGAVVSKVSADETREYYELLSFLEGKCVELAFPNLGKNDLRELKKINQTMCVPSGMKIQREEILKLRNGNLGFHGLLGERSQNSRLPLLMKYLRKRLFRFRFWLIAMKTYYDNNYNDHNEIISYLEKGDCAAARSAMEKHIMRTCKLHLDTLPQL